MKNKWIILTPLLVSALYIPMLAAENVRTIENRVNKLERLVNNKGLVEIMVRLESVQSELQHLLGEVELQKHTLDGIKKRQRDLYLDIDRRLLQIERRSGSNSASSLNTPKKSKIEPINSQTKTKKLAPVVNVKPVTASSPLAAASAANSAKKVGNVSNEQAAYQSAFDLLRTLRYDKATQAFRQFLTDYPNGRYAHIAQYWLAETSYHTRKYKMAVQDYQNLIDQYPKSPKRADALLKIGYSQFELKSYAKSKVVLERLIETYPGTTESGQAENLLQKIRLQKNL